MHIFVYASVGFLIACIFGRRQWFYIRPDDSGRLAGSDVQTTLFCALKSRARLPIGKPIAFVSNRKVLLAPPANRLSRWSNAVADDFVNRLAARAEIKTVGHCPQMGGTSGSVLPPRAWRTLRHFIVRHDQQTVNSVPLANIELLASVAFQSHAMLHRLSHGK